MHGTPLILPREAYSFQNLCSQNAFIREECMVRKFKEPKASSERERERGSFVAI